MITLYALYSRSKRLYNLIAIQLTGERQTRYTRAYEAVQRNSKPAAGIAVSVMGVTYRQWVISLRHTRYTGAGTCYVILR